MQEKTNSGYSFLLVITAFLSFGYFLALLIKTWELEYLLLSKRFLIFVGYLILGIFFLLREYLQNKKNQKNWNITWPFTRIPKWLRGLIIMGLLIIPAVVFLFVNFSNDIFGLAARRTLAITCLSLAILLWAPDRTVQEQIKWFFIFGIFVGAIYSAGLVFNQVTDYPLSLMWSEGNRIWDWSILFGSERYINPVDRPLYAFIDRGRAILWGLPFLIPNIGIWGVRFWNAIVITLPYFLLGLSLVWPEKKRIGWMGILTFGAWSFLYIRQGPVYTPLVLCAIIVVLAVRMKQLPIAAVLVAIAGYYANSTRFHWAYAPGLWAGMLALLNIISPTLKKSDWKKLARPIILGIAGYFGAQILPTIVNWILRGFEGERIILFQEVFPKYTFSQALLWERWWPNQTYGPGIVLGLLVAAGPTLLFLISLRSSKKWKINWLQIISIVFLALAFLGVGLVASVKIGGGGDLHNLDMFLLTILMLVAQVWVIIWNYLNNETKSIVIFSSLLILLLFPAARLFDRGNPLVLPPRSEVMQMIAEIQNEIDIAQMDGGQVLFMDQRQLITFGYIQDLIMVDEYEKKVLIDTAFSEDMVYFQSFYEDLAEHRFNLILTERMYDIQKQDGLFADENNYWATWVIQPVFEHYETLYIYKDYGIQLLVPIQE